MSGPLVIGLGALDRGDDAVGAAVAAAVARRLSGVTVVVHEDPTGLLDVWAGRSPVVIVDAIRSGAAPGAVHRFEIGGGEPGAWARSAYGGTHAIGLAEVVDLARALGRLPGRLVVVGVEAERFDHGAPLSEAVAAAVPTAAARVCEELGHVPR
ncbi:MAG TPA: hydrogenase maturation protease [Nocardioides sp.]|nr:hydrogenase maturation protease [Nocardioides sp.]